VATAAVVDRGKPRAPGYLNLGVVVAMLVLIAAVALTARQQPPPSIAELSPQAQQQLKDAPAEQSSRFGSGPGGEFGDGEATTTTTTEPPAAGKGPKREIKNPGNVRRCVGDPPRQTEDPQSPPCIAYWDGDNGGSTWRGVTANQIDVALPDASESRVAVARTYVDYFNQRFEFYGRKIVLKPFKPTQGAPGSSGSGSEQLQADAVTAADTHGAFASLAYDPDANKGGQGPYYDELALRKVVSFQYYPNFTSGQAIEKRAPYQWAHFPDFTSFQRNLGRWVCRSLKDHPAQYAGSGTVGNKRVFGLIREAVQGSDGFPDASALHEELESCGVSIALDVESDGRSSGQTIMVQMKTNSPAVTSIICLCDGSVLYGTNYMKSASSQSYYPEWIVSNYVYQDNDFNVNQYWPEEQRIHAFGLDYRNKALAEPDMPFRWALTEMGFNGSSPGYDQAYQVYENVLQLATAIQLAGPILTPKTLEEGLFSTTFPNPDCQGPPSYQACVKYAPGHRYQQDDGAMIWWSTNDTSMHWTSPGTYCYADRGRRFTRQAWPLDDKLFFKAPCW
jgi:hypothetical protein